MKKKFTILFLGIALFVNAQTEQENVIRAMKEFHKAMVDKNFTMINQRVDKALSYGHSNGWVETKEELVKHLDSGLVVYNSIIEDSLTIVLDANLATVRFIGDYDVTMNGSTGLYHIRVLEIWVKKGKQWLLFARQAIKE